MYSKICFVSFYIAAVECKTAFDLGVIVDISKSVKEANLPKLRAAVSKVVDEFDISTDGTHMGLITFAEKATLLFDFADPKYHNAKTAKDRISQINKLYFQTRTDKALILADSDLFTAAGGDRPDKPNLLLVFTDGKPTPKPGYKPFSVTVPPLEVGRFVSKFIKIQAKVDLLNPP